MTSNDNKAPSSAGQIGVATLRSAMFDQQFKAGEQIEAQLTSDVKHPREVQEELLFDLLKNNVDTPFGREHNFSNIKTIEDFKKEIPLTTYDDYAGYIF